MKNLEDNFISLDDINKAEEKTQDSVAVIGMSCRFPYGEEPEDFFQNIIDGNCFVRKFTGQRKQDIDAYLKCAFQILSEEVQYFDGSYLEDIDKFDYRFFNMTPKEAELLEPSHRLFLENTVKAIEDAGYGGDRLKGTATSIFIGYSGSIKDSYENMILNVATEDVPLSIVNNMNGMIGGRIAYLYDLRGVSELIDTACASSLVAVHSACQSILDGESTMAIAGSVRLQLVPIDSELSRVGVEAQDYMTRSFDENGDGFGLGEGVVTLILKSLKVAEQDGDNIYAVIKGSAVNQGGNSMGLTVTNPDALCEVIQKAWEESGVAPEDIELLETHGTATSLGDPIELKGVTDAFSRYTSKKGFCAVGSVKSNMGHLYEASGMAGLLKVILALQYKKLPATLYFNTPNSNIDFVESPLYVNVKTRDWDTKKGKRSAAVNSLGLCGTNSHIVLEEYVPQSKRTESGSGEYMLLLSAKSESALQNLCKAYRKFLVDNTAELHNICYTSAVGRWHYSYRIAFMFQTKEELERQIGLVLEQGFEKIEEPDIFFGKTENSQMETETFCDVRKQDLKEICSLYIAGRNINWQQYYQNCGYQIEHIPTYQFDKERCWLEIAEPESLEDCFAYQIAWCEKQLGSKKATEEKILLVGYDALELGLYQKKLEDQGITSSVLLEDQFAQSSLEEYTSTILFTYREDRTKERSNAEKLKQMYAGLELLVKLSQKQKWNYIGLVTSHVNKVTGEETAFIKENAPYIALLQAIGKENADIRIKIIDREEQVSSQAIAEELLEQEESYVAYRAGKRYIPVFSEAGLQGNTPVVLKEGAFYLVTGGLGEIALEICHMISKRVHATFLLVSRRTMPERSEWNEIVQGEQADILRKIEAIEANGSKVVIQSADVGEETSVRQAVEKFQKINGNITGVIHCAGLSDNTVMNQLDGRTLQKVMEPKALGLVNLYQIFGTKVEFYLLSSSIATTFTAPMQGAYIAANAYLDAAAEELTMQGAKVLAINWTTWKEIGMAAKNNLAKDLIFQTLPTQEALDLLEQALEKHNGNRVIIGKLNNTKLGANLLMNSKVHLSKKIEECAEALKAQKAGTVTSSQQTAKVTLTGKDGEKESYTEIEKKVAGICRKVLGYKTVNVYENFFEMGADSLQIMNIHKEIEKIYPQKLELTDMFNYSCIAKVAEFLELGKETDNTAVDMQVLDSNYTVGSDDIAIIGVAAKIPKAETLDDLFENLLKGQCVIDKLPKWRRDYLIEYMKYKKMDTSKVSFTNGGYLEDIDKFDYEFFHLSPKEAMLIDPHQRIYMELALTAMEDAGYSAERMRGTNTGVFLGFGTNLRDMYARLIYDVCPEGVVDSVVGNTDAVMAGRISHEFHLKGPSMVINTACSSSLTALDTAIKFMKSGCIDMALVGGIKLILMPVEDGNVLMKIGMESSDGFTRTLDESSDGTGFSEGGEMMLLKPFYKAVQDGDHIYGIIKGIEMNQDGNSSSITAPNPDAQTEVIVKAWNSAKINPETINYVEVHGTGTQLGDTIEYKSLDRAFRKYTDKKAFCAVNSVKPNYGHLSEGSGLFGLLKGLLALQKECIPKNILFQNPNGKINMIDSAMYVNTKNLAWPKQNKEPRTFAVSNFGMSGTNVHLVVQEYKDERKEILSDESRIVTFSNKTEEGLQTTINQMLEFLVKKEIHLDDLSYTLNTGRGHYECRLAVICSSVEELFKSLQYYVSQKKCDEQSFTGYVQIISDDRPVRHEYEKHNSEMLSLTEEAKAAVAEKYLEEISKAYVSGARINWLDLYQDRGYKHVSLPTYEFKKQTCFVRIPKSDSDINEDSLFYEVKWKKQEKAASKIPKNKNVLVFMVKGNDISIRIVEELKKKNKVVIVTDEEISSSYHSETDYEVLLKQEECMELDYILNLNTLADIGPEEMEQLGVLLMLRLCKGIVQTNLSRRLKLITITQNLWEITGEEKKYTALGAATVGLNRVIGLEFPKITSHSIDIDTTCSAAAILSEVEEEKTYYETSLRNGNRFILEFDVSEMNELDEKSRYQAKSDGVYVITGGTGGMGLVLAKQLASTNLSIHIALICRSSRYKEDEKCMASIDELRRNGTSVEIVIANVADSQQIHEAFQELKKQYGYICGVIHAAGNASAEILATRSEEKLKEVLAPKYYGSIHILKEIEKEKVDFFVLCSSGCTLTAEMSQGDYVAANTFLDAFTYMANQRGVKTHCINWVSWKSEGMSVRYHINVDETFKALVNEDAVYAFEKIIVSDSKKCLVGKLNYRLLKQENYNIDQMPLKLTERIGHYISQTGAKKKDIEFVPLKTKQVKKQVQKVAVEGLEEEENYKDTECEIAQIFGSVLGRDTINVYDNFFECGGDSVLLVRLHEALQEKYPDKLKFLDLFTYTSAKKIAVFLNAGDIEPSDIEEEREAEDDTSVEDLDQLMQQFEHGEISEEDMIRVLEGIGGEKNEN